jgi:predicted nuclease with TOPRIM domain
MTDYCSLSEAVKALESGSSELFEENKGLKMRIKSIQMAYRMSEEDLKAANQEVEELTARNEQLLKEKFELRDELSGYNELVERNVSLVFELRTLKAALNLNRQLDAAPQPAQPLKDREQIAADILNDTFKDTDEEAHPTPADFVRAGYTADGQPPKGNVPMTREEISAWDRRAAEILNAEILNATFAEDDVPRGTSKDRPLDRPAIAYPPRVSPDPAIDTDKYLTSRDTWFIKE